MSRLTQDRVQQLYQEYGDLKVLDDIIRYRAGDELQVPILGYPRYPDRINEYEGFTGRQLDSFIDGAVKRYLSLGLEPVRQSDHETRNYFLIPCLPLILGRPWPSCTPCPINRRLCCVCVRPQPAWLYAAVFIVTDPATSNPQPPKADRMHYLGARRRLHHHGQGCSRFLRVSRQNHPNPHPTSLRLSSYRSPQPTLPANL